MSEDIHQGQAHTALGDVAARTLANATKPSYVINHHSPVAGASAALDTT